MTSLQRTTTRSMIMMVRKRQSSSMVVDNDHDDRVVGSDGNKKNRGTIPVSLKQDCPKEVTAPVSTSSPAKRIRIEKDEEVLEDKETPPRVASPSSATSHLLPLESLPQKVLQEVLLYLDCPREIFILATNIKVFHQAIQPRPDIVVRSAVFKGGISRSAINTLVDALKNQHIHVPSTMRLLRFVNAKYCELGEDCWNYNLETKLPKTLGLADKKKSHSLGLCVCSDCFDRTLCPSISLFENWAFSEDGLSKNEKFAMSGHWEYAIREYSMLREEFVEAATGEKAGPLILRTQIAQIASTFYGDESWRGRSHQTSHPNCGSARDAIRTLVESVVSQQQEKDIARRVLIANSRQEAMEREEGELKARERKWEEEWKARDQKREEKGKQVVEKFKAAFGELAAYTYPELFDCNFSSTGNGKFEIEFVDEILGPYVRAPSKRITKAMMGTIIERLVDIVAVLEEQSFLGKPANVYSFLDHEHDPVLKALASYFRSLGPGSILKRSQSGWNYKSVDPCQSNFAEYISRGEPLEALCSFISFHEHVTHDNSNFDSECQIFCSGVVHEQNIKPNTERWSRFYKLAVYVYKTESGRSIPYLYPYSATDASSHYAKFKTRYLQRRVRFYNLLSLIYQYKTHPQTMDFLKANRRAQAFSRKDAVNTIFNPTPKMRTLLVSRKFTNLLAIHRNMYASREVMERSPL